LVCAKLHLKGELEASFLYPFEYGIEIAFGIKPRRIEKLAFSLVVAIERKGEFNFFLVLGFGTIEIVKIRLCAVFPHVLYSLKYPYLSFTFGPEEELDVLVIGPFRYIGDCYVERYEVFEIADAVDFVIMAISLTARQSRAVIIRMDGRFIIVIVVIDPEDASRGNHLVGVVLAAEETVVVGIKEDVG
jgi:hypothetical protein